jgi:hypothetical protein
MCPARLRVKAKAGGSGRGFSHTKFSSKHLVSYDFIASLYTYSTFLKCALFITCSLWHANNVPKSIRVIDAWPFPTTPNLIGIETLKPECHPSNSNRCLTQQSETARRSMPKICRTRISRASSSRCLHTTLPDIPTPADPHTKVLSHLRAWNSGPVTL